MKNFIGKIFILIILFLFFNFLIFFFSYVSLINNKVFDQSLINSIQRNLYFGGLRNIYQSNINCIKFDEDLLYVSKDGICNFKNIEFNTKLSFMNGIRNNQNKLGELSTKTGIAILGDSFTMGWGVNDNETYSSILERLLNKKVYNLGVSSYGTVREIKKFKKSDIFDKVDTIIIQYDPNDFKENLESDINKKYTLQDFQKLLDSEPTLKKKISFFLRQYKKTFRTIYRDIIKNFFPQKFITKIDFNDHYKVIQKIIYDNLDYKNKKILIMFPENLNFIYYNYEKSSEYLSLLKLDMKENKENFFIIDDHWTKIGHQTVANELYKILSNKN